MLPHGPAPAAWKQVLPIALVVLAVGFYGQYTQASGVFAADGLVDRAELLVQRLLEPSPSVLPEPSLGGLADPGVAVTQPAPNSSDSSPAARGAVPVTPPRANLPFVGRFRSCSSNHCR